MNAFVRNEKKKCVNMPLNQKKEAKIFLFIQEREK
jgi:hypothetical protein